MATLSAGFGGHVNAAPADHRSHDIGDAAQMIFPPLSALPWRLIGAGAAVVAVLGSAWHYGHTRYEAGEAAVQARWDAERLIAAEAFAKQAAAVAATVEADKAISDKVQHELETRLGDSDARARDLAGRLRDYQASARGCAVSGAADRAAGPATAPGEPGGDEAIERATAAVLTACGHDASRLQGFQDWWRGVVESRR